MSPTPSLTDVAEAVLARLAAGRGDVPAGRGSRSTSPHAGDPDAD
jgi:hypothetical protein